MERSFLYYSTLLMEDRGDCTSSSDVRKHNTAFCFYSTARDQVVMHNIS